MNSEWAHRELFANLHQQIADLKRALNHANQTAHAATNSSACLQTQMFKLQQSKAHGEKMNIRLADMLNSAIHEVPNDTNLMALVNDINSKQETITELEILVHQQQRTIEDQKLALKRLQERQTSTTGSLHESTQY